MMARIWTKTDRELYKGCRQLEITPYTSTDPYCVDILNNASDQFVRVNFTTGRIQLIDPDGDVMSETPFDFEQLKQLIHDGLPIAKKRKAKNDHRPNANAHATADFD